MQAKNRRVFREWVQQQGACQDVLRLGQEPRDLRHASRPRRRPLRRRRSVYPSRDPIQKRLSARRNQNEIQSAKIFQRI